jgi:hypothetical protein
MSGNHDRVRLANELKAVADLRSCSVIEGTERPS